MTESGLEGRVAVVTGAGSGIGRRAAVVLAEAGASVVVSDITLDRARAVADEIVAGGGSAVGVACNVAAERQIKDLVDRACDEYGGLDIIHNNAAAVDTPTQAGDGNVAEMDTALWDRVMLVNLRGTMLGCKYAVPAMKRRGGGSIINTSSLMASAGDLRLTAYSASKAAIESLTRSVATQFGPDGIRCNAVAPGSVATPERGRPTYLEDLHLPHVALRRLGSVSDCAAAVLFLASGESSYITGQVLTVDGGLGIHHPWARFDR